MNCLTLRAIKKNKGQLYSGPLLYLWMKSSVAKYLSVNTAVCEAIKRLLRVTGKQIES